MDRYDATSGVIVEAGTSKNIDNKPSKHKQTTIEDKEEMELKNQTETDGIRKSNRNQKTSWIMSGYRILIKQILLNASGIA